MAPQQDTTLDSFLQLKFYPPIATEFYVNEIPTEVKKTIVNYSNLKDKGLPTNEVFLLLLTTYCTPTHSLNFTDDFWNILVAELKLYYETE